MARQSAAMRNRDGAGAGEPEADPPEKVGVIALGPKKWLEEALGHGGREADPAVDHRDLDAASRDTGSHGHSALPGAVADRVFEQDPQHTAKVSNLGKYDYVLFAVDIEAVILASGH